MFKFEIFDSVYIYGENLNGVIIARTEWLDEENTYLVAGIKGTKLFKKWYNEKALKDTEE